MCPILSTQRSLAGNDFFFAKFFALGDCTMNWAGFSPPRREERQETRTILPFLKRKAERFAWIVVELFATCLDWYWPPLQGGYSLMDLINRGHFLFFSARPRFHFGLCDRAHRHCFSRSWCS